MAQTGVSGYKKPMVRFWALAVAVLSTLGVAGQLIAQEAEPTDPAAAELVDEASTVVRVYHVDEYIQAAAIRRPTVPEAQPEGVDLIFYV